MIFAWEGLKKLASENLDAARHILMDILANYRGYTKTELVLVFDGYKSEFKILPFSKNIACDVCNEENSIY